MTDNDIIKALECCTVCSSIETCGRCPYAECPTRKGCVGEMVKDALDLINRQKAEIERLTEEVNSKYKWENKLDKTIKETESEAIKGFEDKILDLFPADKNHTTISRFTVKQIVKEMVGDTE